MDNKTNRVNISYSAQEQRELDAIRAKYLPLALPPMGSLEKIKKLDARVESRAAASGLSVGIVSALVMGGGMALELNLGQPGIGILVSALGLAGMAAAWPLYRKVLKKERQKAAPEILRLSGEE